MPVESNVSAHILKSGSFLPIERAIVVKVFLSSPVPPTKINVFVDGEFWHGYQWERKRRRLKANRSYWIPKIERNVLRDRKYNRMLKREGWKVLRFWQHKIKEDLSRCVQKIKKEATKNSK